jgi:hypothetical protein
MLAFARAKTAESGRKGTSGNEGSSAVIGAVASRHRRAPVLYLQHIKHEGTGNAILGNGPRHLLDLRPSDSRSIAHNACPRHGVIHRVWTGHRISPPTWGFSSISSRWRYDQIL